MGSERIEEREIREIAKAPDLWSQSARRAALPDALSLLDESRNRERELEKDRDYWRRWHDENEPRMSRLIGRERELREALKEMRALFPGHKEAKRLAKKFGFELPATATIEKADALLSKESGDVG
jgi:hypothetical protein